MLNDGFQYLEQRDANDNITKSGVVGKKSAFATSDNKGIYDVIAEDLRYLYDNYSASNVQSVLANIQSIYNEMKTDPSWGASAAALSAKDAIAAADKAAKAQAQADTDATSAATARTAAETANAAVQKALTAVTDYATKAQASAGAALLSEKNAKSSEAAASSSAANSKSSADLSKEWAVSTGSPDGAADTDSTTGKTQSSRTWALYSESEAKAAANTAKNVQTVMSDAVAQLKEAFTGASKLIMYVDGADEASPIISRMKCDDGTTYDISIVRAGTSEPVTGIDTYLKED